MKFNLFMTHLSIICSTLVIFSLVVGCHSLEPAPVVDIPTNSPILPSSVAQNHESSSNFSYYTVQKGDSLHGIALKYHVSLSQLRQWNHLTDPNKLMIGQKIALISQGFFSEKTAKNNNTSKSRATTTPSYSSSLSPQKIPNEKNISPKIKNEDKINWAWPTKGTIINHFTNAGKGIDIKGQMGQPIYTAASGKVIHTGSQLRGYGKLIIVQHSSMFLSAYAHNSEILVKEGQYLQKGQKIAKMGNTDSIKPELHFEIRRFGKPVDPLLYLPQPKNTASLVTLK